MKGKIKKYSKPQQLNTPTGAKYIKHLEKGKARRAKKSTARDKKAKSSAAYIPYKTQEAYSKALNARVKKHLVKKK